MKNKISILEIKKYLKESDSIFFFIIILQQLLLPQASNGIKGFEHLA